MDTFYARIRIRGINMDSYAVYMQAVDLVRQCGTRDPLKIACELGISVYHAPLDDLLGMFTFRWNHRIMLINENLDHYMEQMVAGHELGHDRRHRELAKAGGMKEFTLFNMKDTTEYEANAFSAHILLDNDDVYGLARQGYDVVQVAHMLNSDINLMLIKMQEMNKLGYDFTIPNSPDSRFFRRIKGGELGSDASD